ncbi:MAG: carboxypeptidase-like regulatory domain-containing protein, partial [Daejeonella sp.]
MMKFSVLTFISFFFILSNTSAQNTLEGRITDAKTGNALAYVNIGVIGKNIGTLTNDEGKFKISIPESYNSDQLRVSMLGYNPRIYTVSDFRNTLAAEKEIALEPSSFQLQEVAISGKPLKEKILGNHTESQSSTGGFTSNKLGNEIGIIIKIKKSPSYLRSFTASVASKKNKPVKLRLNFYSVKNGLPDTILLDKNIIVEAPLVKGKLSVDLKPYKIVVEDDFFVSLEWIEDSPGKGLMFSASLFGSPLIARETSQGSWEKVG